MAARQKRVPVANKVMILVDQEDVIQRVDGPMHNDKVTGTAKSLAPLPEGWRLRVVELEFDRRGRAYDMPVVGATFFEE